MTGRMGRNLINDKAKGGRGGGAVAQQREIEMKGTD